MHITKYISYPEIRAIGTGFERLKGRGRRKIKLEGIKTFRVMPRVRS